MNLKIDHLGEEVLKKRLPGITELAKTFAGVDVTKEPIPVVPTCHYMMGGIPTNVHGQALTVDNKGNDKLIDGLFAAGECACVSVHGANRLGANSLLDIVVFGRAAGLYLEESLRDGVDMPAVSQGDIDAAMTRVERWNNAQSGEDVASLRTKLQKVMEEDFGVFREAAAMDHGFNRLKELKERIDNAALADHSKVFNTARVEAFELDNLMLVAEASAACANARTESRGAHSRLDFPERDDKNWLKHSLYHPDGTITSREVNFKPTEMDPIKLKKREY